MQRLGKNQGGYGGETIKIGEIFDEIQLIAERTGWDRQVFLDTPQLTLCAYHRTAANPKSRLYLSAGIHGDEPAGPLAVLELFRKNEWSDAVEMWICPCLNPEGFVSNRRENASGHDLNRDYRHLETAEIRAHAAWLQTLPKCDLAVLLHEDWEANGFYLYELNPLNLPSFAPKLIQEVAKVCPIEHASTVDNWSASGGIIRPQTHPRERPQWAEAVYLVMHNSARSYTLEAPSDFPLSIRVRALTMAVGLIIAGLESPCT
jgi:protein MpaA